MKAHLPRRSEGVAGDVTSDEEQAGELSVGSCLLRLGVTELEGRGAHHYEKRNHPVEVAVALARHEETHEHHGEHLARLREYLRRERDVLEHLVLAHARDHVGVGAERVLVRRQEAPLLRRSVEYPDDDADDDSSEAVGEDEEIRGGEGVGRGWIRLSHDALLQKSPRQVRHEHTDATP